MSIQVVSSAAVEPALLLTPNASDAACIIKLSRGHSAFCDAADFPFLSQMSWHINGLTGMAKTTIANHSVYMHQFVLLTDTACRINHRDGNRLNNCRSNLRLASTQQILGTCRKSQKRVFTSIYKGVFFDKVNRRWKAKIKQHGVSKYLGTFENEEAAARAYDAAARQAFGDFAYQNLASNQPPRQPPAIVDPSLGCPSITAHDNAPNSTSFIPVAGSVVAALCDQRDFAFLSRFRWLAESLNGTDYPVTSVCGTTFSMHQLALKTKTNRTVTHRDGNVFNNTRANLRLTTLAEHKATQPKHMGPRATSRYKGVSKRGGNRWYAEIALNGVETKLGSFTDEEAAARAYDRAARELFGPIAYLNFPE